MLETALPQAYSFTHVATVLSTQLQVSQNPARRVLLQLSVPLSPFCLTASLGDKLTL